MWIIKTTKKLKLITKLKLWYKLHTYNALVWSVAHSLPSFFVWNFLKQSMGLGSEPVSRYCNILPSQIRFFERVFWVHHKFLVANRHFFCSEWEKRSDNTLEIRELKKLTYGFWCRMSPNLLSHQLCSTSCSTNKTWTEDLDSFFFSVV